jgi:predicted ATPase
MRLSEVTITPRDGSAPFVLHLPAPELPGEPDVVVIGGANGVGKTTVLDAIAAAARDAGIPCRYRRERDIRAHRRIARGGDAAILRPWVADAAALEASATMHLSAGLATYLRDMRLVRHAGRFSGGMMLVDMPETFLNADIQRTWVHTATRLAPGLQFVLATHSEEIFASVAPCARVMLRSVPPAER